MTDKNGQRVIYTDLNASQENEKKTAGWSLTEGIGKLWAKLTGESELNVNIAGDQKTTPGYYLYQSEVRTEEGAWISADSQNFVGWSDKETEAVKATMKFTITLPESEEEEIEVVPEETPGEIPGGGSPEEETKPGTPETTTPAETKPGNPTEDGGSGGGSGAGGSGGGGGTGSHGVTPSTETPAGPGAPTPAVEEITNTEVPLTEAPAVEEIAVAKTASTDEIAGGAVINDGDVPLAAVPAGVLGIVDEAVPLGALPQTGAVAAHSNLYLVLFSISAAMAGLAAVLWIGMNRKKEF